MARVRTAGSVNGPERHAAAGQPWQRQPRIAAAAAGGNGSSGGGGSGRPRGTDGRFIGRMPDPQPDLQAWLEQKQGLSAADADQHARRLAAVFGGDQQAALAGLPATFAFCNSKGLSGLQTAQLLDRIAKYRRDSVVSFAATAQRDWQLIEPYIAAGAQRQRQAGERLPKHDSFAALLCGRKDAAQMLATTPGHVAVWLAAVGKQLPNAADVGRMLLNSPLALGNNPKSTLAALRWFFERLEVQEEQLAGYTAKAVKLLGSDPATLQAKLEALQAVLPPQLTLQLALKEPRLLGVTSATAQQALTWLQGQFGGDAERLQAVLERGPQLLQCSAASLQQRAAYLQRQLGWQPGDGQLAAFVEKYPQPFAIVSFDSPDKQALLLLLTGVVGVSLKDCLGQWSSYLKGALETTAARYMLVQERAPWLLYDRDGELRLSWIVDAPKLLPECGAATKAEVLEFESAWPKSDEGARLLAALRSGSTAGWPRPPSWEEAVARRQQHVPGRERMGGTAARQARQGRGRGRKQQ